jgi:hypothetical protein
MSSNKGELHCHMPSAVIASTLVKVHDAQDLKVIPCGDNKGIQLKCENGRTRKMQNTENPTKTYL